ncbi:MAG: sugar porter family MFS transporter [Chitinophagaceae bacterium]|nr:sugar porter family MFS transporter [Chitinophagaceae bacterium]
MNILKVNKEAGILCNHLEKMNRYTLLISSIAAIGGLLFGFDTAVIAGTLKYIQPLLNLSNAQLGVVVSATSVGCIPGALFSGIIADRFGRKKILLLAAFFYVLSALGSAYSNSYTDLILFRFLGGVAIGMASTLAPIYISEISPASIRGRLGMLQQLAIVMGILLSYLSNYFIDNGFFSFLVSHNYWRYMFGAATIPSVLFFLLIFFIPESPRWLVLKNRVPEAERIFSKVENRKDVESRIDKIKEDLNLGNPNQKKIIFTKKYRRILFIGSAFAALAQLTGINIIFYYAPLIFERTKLGDGILFQTMLAGIVNLFFTLVAFLLIDRIGRKKLLLFGSGIMGICLIILGYFFMINKLDTYLILVFIFCFIGAFACSWGAVLWVYVAEIFSNQIRGTATSIAVFFNWTANAIVILTFPIILANLGGAITFYIYGIINILAMLFVSRFIFETKGIELEKIENYY